MKTDLFKRLLCAALIACGATLAHAGNERPRDTGVACARAGNTYCNLQEPAAGRLPHGAATEGRATD
ncbi:hypothetical protein CTP10_R15500 [Cupriavidus sp. P-10]|uniref:hypothetical protein n=1 Tax=Cupriavidus sp. P-10 TaxID=2027911 RepID=UPI000ED248B2|nr:hypothetical protein [Cupriavidus sp. P-10]BDB24202.1 hypothetical protein CTP10_R15500 [Cupriavidus sp. P-10]